MGKQLLAAAFLVALGVALGVALTRRGTVEAPTTEGPRISRSPEQRVFVGAPVSESDAARSRQELKSLATALQSEIAERHRVERRIDELAAQLANLQAPAAEEHADNGSAPVESAKKETASAAGAAAAAATPDGASSTERALIAAGLAPADAARIKLQEDQYTLSRMYLRDQATREGWVDTPRFSEEMQALDDQRPSIRDEIGDGAYDRYLAAAGRPNRVTVDEVLQESPAAQAGLQAGDVVLRYGDMRIFAPEDLVGETRGGEAGETVQLEVLRQGQRIAIDVPRGPLGVRIDASQAQPDDG